MSRFNFRRLPSAYTLFDRLLALPERVAGLFREPARYQVPRARLSLEGMEDRLVPATLSGHVYIDTNANGAYDSGEAGVASAAVFAVADIGVSGTLTADASGQYTSPDFQFVPTNVTVTLTGGIPVGYQVTTPNPVVVPWTSGGARVDFGVRPVAAPTTTALSSSGAITYGQSSTFTATVASGSGTPTGTVTFLDGGVALGTVSLSNGVATFGTSTLSAGTHSITAVYDGDGTHAGSTSAPVSQMVGAKVLTVSGVTANSKVYDASTAATLNAAGATLTGVVAGDEVNLNSAGATGTFASKDAGTGIGVTVSGFNLLGAQAGNYVLAQPDGLSGNITPATLTITGVSADDKVYDGTAAAALSGTATLSGVYGGDSVGVSAGPTTGTFASPNVGTGIGVTLATSFTLSGPQAGNYTLTPPTFTANITPKTLIVSGVTVHSKVYDASTVATLNAAGVSLTGVVAGDEVSLNSAGTTGTFASKDVGADISVTASGFSLSGAQAGNYTLTQPMGLTADITPKALTVTSVTANNKVYDGVTAATLSTNSAALAGVVSGDDVSLSSAGATGTFASKDAGTGIGMTVSGFNLLGAQAGNYTLAQPTGLTADIAPAALTVIANDQSSAYGAALPPLTYTYSGLVGGDTSSVFSGVLATSATPFSSPGTYSITQGSLTAGSNYAITFTGASLTIIPAVWIAPIGDQENIEGDAVSVGVTASSSTPNATLAYSASNLPAGLNIDSGTGIISGTIAVGAATAGDDGQGHYAVMITVTDGTHTATTTVAWAVERPNTNPVAENDTFSGLVNGIITGNVLSNDTDGDGDALSASLVSGPSNGTLTLNSDGSFTYTPHSRFATANDSFTYQVCDGRGGTATATATIQRVFWVSPTGGDWSDTANWNAGLLPGAEDGVTLSQDVTIPGGFGATVWGLITTGASLQVNGSLTVTNRANLAGWVGVGSSGAIYNATASIGSFVLSGGAGIGGVFDTAGAAETLLSGAGKVFALTGAGDLTGDGLVRVSQAELNVSNASETLTRLTVEGGGSVAGSADVTVTVALIAKQATFTGAAGSKITVSSFAEFSAPAGTATVFDARDFMAEEAAPVPVKIEGDQQLKNGASTAYYGTTNWSKGNISITGLSTFTNGGEFNIQQGAGKITGGVRQDGVPDGSFVNQKKIEIESGFGDVRFENVAFVNHATGEISSASVVQTPANRLIFSGGTGVHRGSISLSDGSDDQLVLTNNAAHTAHTGSMFAGGILVIRNGATLAVPVGQSTEVSRLRLTGDTAGGTVTGGGAVKVTRLVDDAFEWTWGVVGNVVVTVGWLSGAKIGPLENNPGAVRMLNGGILRVVGAAEVTADLSVVNGGRIIVDGIDGKGDGTDGNGVFTVQFASIKTDPQQPGLPFWAKNKSTVRFESNVNNNNPTGSIELPVVVDGSTLASKNFKFQAGFLQRGDSTTTIEGKTVVNGKATTHEGPGHNVWSDESVHISGGTLRIKNTTSELVTEWDVVIKSGATLHARGQIRVGPNETRNVHIEGTLLLTTADNAVPGSLGIFGHLILDGRTQVQVTNTASDYIEVSRTITLGGTLKVDDQTQNVANRTWTIFKAGTALPADEPAVTSDFNSVETAGFSAVKDPLPPPSKLLKVLKGNG